MELETERLRLRHWTPADRAPFAAMNADPRVVEYLLAPLTAEQSNAMVDRIEAHFQAHGYGLWAVEEKGGAPFIGFVGLTNIPFEAHFTPNVEVGWRLAHAHWGKGYATEAAKAALDAGLGVLGLPEVVSMTVAANERSWHVMEKIGLVRSADDDFLHPRVPEGHPLRAHILYRSRK